MLYTIVLLQSQNGSSPAWLPILPYVMIFGIFYFLLIAPARKRHKTLQTTLEALKKGDRVVTNGGLYGEVAAVDNAVVVLKVADGVKVRVAKSAISGLEPGQSQEGQG